MSPQFDPGMYSALFERHVGAHRRRMDELREELERRGEPFDPLEHEQILVGIRPGSRSGPTSNTAWSSAAPARARPR
jgi:hypothetical protein